MSDSTRRILLSGASGLIGSALVRALGPKRIQSTQLVRAIGLRGEQIRGQTVWDPGAAEPVSDAEALEGMDAAIHLSGANLSAHRWTEGYKREIVDSRVGSTRALARTLRSLRQPPKALLCASATGIYGNRADEVLGEGAASGEGFLADTCVQWEAAADAAKGLGIRVVRLRFGVVLSGRGGALGQMLPIFRLGAGGRLGTGRQWLSWIALQDLISAILFLLETETLEGPVNLVAPHPVTNAEFTRALGRTVHRPTFVPAPAFALRLAFGAMADAALLSSTRAVPERLLKAGFKFQYPEIGAALRAVV
jgi:uncharacterized protein